MTNHYLKYPKTGSQGHRQTPKTTPGDLFLDEILLVAILVTTVNAVFDAVFVAWIAAARGPKAFDRWVRSDKAKPALKVIAQNVREEVLPDLPTSKALHVELEVVRADLGRMHAELSAEMPPNIDGRMAEMEKAVQGAVAQIRQIDQGIGAAFSALDSKLGAAFGAQGANQAALVKMAADAGQDLEGAMQGTMQNLDTNNPMVRQFYVWASKPVDEKWAAKHPFEAMIVQGGKMWFGQNILPQLAGEGQAGVTRYGVSKGDKIL